jgi:hypothetical protein
LANLPEIFLQTPDGTRTTAANEGNEEIRSRPLLASLPSVEKASLPPNQCFLPPVRPAGSPESSSRFRPGREEVVYGDRSSWCRRSPNPVAIRGAQRSARPTFPSTNGLGNMPFRRARDVPRWADWKSAIRQVGNLHYCVCVSVSLRLCVKNKVRIEFRLHNLAIPFFVSHQNFRHLICPDAFTGKAAVSSSSPTAYAPGIPAWRKKLARHCASHLDQLNGPHSRFLQKTVFNREAVPSTPLEGRVREGRPTPWLHWRARCTVQQERPPLL